MSLRSFFFFPLVALFAGTVAAQSPATLTLPGPIDRHLSPATATKITDDPATRYRDRHEAAVSALQAGDTVSLAGKRERALGLFLLSAKRDPGYGKAIFNAGIVCAQLGFNADALKFYQEAKRVDSSPEMAKAAAVEVERVEYLASLEATAEGRRRRATDIKFLDLLTRTADAAVTLDATSQLLKTDPNRWELFALAGLLQAAQEQFGESARSLQNALRLAPAERRKQLTAAAEIAEREATFKDLMQRADAAWDGKRYEASAKLYASAWDSSPTRFNSGAQAATAFLMADQVPLAVQVLVKLRQTGTPEAGAKAAAMLNQLAAVSDVPPAGPRDPSALSGAESPSSPAEQIAKTLGDLTSKSMKLAAAPVAPLLRDDTKFTYVRDEEVDSPKELLLRSGQSVFEIYQTNLAAIQPSNPDPANASAISDTTAPSAPTLALPGHPPALEAPKAPPPPLPAQGGPEASVSVAGKQPGAVVTFDGRTETACTAPCRLSLTYGRHTYVAAATGFRDLLGVVEIAGPSVPPVNLEFEPKRGNLSVASLTPGSPIFLDGLKTAQITPGDFVLPEGDHTVGIEIGGKMSEQVVKVKDRDLVRVRFQN